MKGTFSSRPTLGRNVPTTEIPLRPIQSCDPRFLPYVLPGSSPDKGTLRTRDQSEVVDRSHAHLRRRVRRGSAPQEPPAPLGRSRKVAASSGQPCEVPPRGRRCQQKGRQREGNACSTCERSLETPSAEARSARTPLVSDLQRFSTRGQRRMEEPGSVLQPRIDAGSPAPDSCSCLASGRRPSRTLQSFADALD